MLKNLIYFGSPTFSAQILEAILKSKLVNVVGVVTTPDKPQGRKQILTPSPVSQMAEGFDLPVYKPNKLDEDHLHHIKLLKPDIFLVVSFGKIVPKVWLDTPTLGTFNVHFSLLPKYRGALCISEAIKNQDEETGVTLMEMDEKLDHGNIISQTKVAIDLDDDILKLTTKLTRAAEQILIDKLPEICAQNYLSSPQDESLVTFTSSHKSLTHSSAFIPWKNIEECLGKSDSDTSPKLHALIRSLSPEPGAWTNIADIDLKLLKTSLVDKKLIIDTVQIPGKNPTSWKQFAQGHLLNR